MQAPVIDLPLRDIHLPEPVSWWPPAPGWWLLLALSIALVATGWWLLARYRRRRVLRQLQQELQHIREGYLQDKDAAVLGRLSVLLRRACLSFYPRHEVASLTGDDWLGFLNSRTRNAFDDDAAQLLLQAPYRDRQQAETVDVKRLIRIIEQQLPVLFNRAVNSHGH